MQKQIFKILFLLVIFLMLPKFAQAATYYVAPTGTGWTCSNAVPCPLINGIGSMVGGDTLILKDGTYAGQSISSVPSGISSSQYTIVRSENVAGAVIDMSGVSAAWSDTAINFYNKSYIQVDGIKVVGNSSHTSDNSSGVIVVGGTSHHIKFLRVSASGGPSLGNTSTIDIGDSGYATHDILLEECWVWGTSRYKILVYRADKVIIRRCVIRHDYQVADGSFSKQEALIANYDSSNTQFQNNILIDSGEVGRYPNEAMYGAIWDEAHGPPETFINKSAKYIGNITLNIKNNHAAHLDKPSGTKVYQNNVIWDSGSGGYLTAAMGAGNESPFTPTMSMSNNTFGGFSKPTGTNTDLNDTYQTGGIALGNSADGGLGTFSVANSIIYGATLAGITSNFTSTYNDLYSNALNYLGVSAGIGDKTTNPLTNGLLYLPQIENASMLKTAGSDGSQIGAQIIKQYGKAGTLYGEAGYDLLQDGTNNQADVNLWPFPNEDKIKTDFASYAGPGPSGARGFTAGISKDGSSQTLTKYIWEYLGNQIPAEIYGAQADVVAPAAPSALSVQ